MKAFVDTNILIDYLAGVSKAKKELALYSEVHVSLITWMEILVGAKDEDEEKEIKNFLLSFKVCEISQNIAERSVKIRKDLKVRLPDAIVLASAEELGLLLVTRNSKDFSTKNPRIRVPYRL